MRPEPVDIPLFPNIPIIFRLPVQPADRFSSARTARKKPKAHDARHIHKIELSKGLEQDKFEKIRKHHYGTIERAR